MCIFNSRLRFLLFVPVLFLVMGCFYFKSTDEAVYQALLDNKRAEIHHHINMLAMAVESEPPRSLRACRRIVADSMAYLDSQPLVWGGAYQLSSSGDYKLISVRDHATTLDPMDYPDFITAVGENVSGDVVVYFEPGGDAPSRNVYFYYRWMPVHAQARDRLLVVSGVSRLSLEVSVRDKILFGQVVMLGFTFTINIVLVALLIYLGNIYASRYGSTRWRGGGI